MIRNLVENARIHGGGGGGRGDVEVALSRSADGFARLDVLDRGPGVPEEARERIFEPFTRLPGSPGAGSVPPGTGLGLSLARQVARRHGGDVVSLPRDGGGSLFRATVRISS